MQREIKFRAWDKSKKEMIYYPLWSTLHDRHVLYFSKINDSYVDEMDNDTSLQLMEFTGLKDKSGKEIYEGDIVRVDWGGLEKSEDFLKDTFAIEFRNYGWFPFTHALPMPKNVEVIGNIYENPALLSNPQ